MDRKTIILLVSLVLVGLFLSEIDDATGQAFLDFFRGSKSKTSPTVCEDSDKGKDYYKKGTVTYTYRKPGYKGTSTETFKDKCKSKITLKEYYCSNNKVKTKKYKCPKGCKNRACIKAEVQSNQTECSDTDGGAYLFVKGTTRTSTGRIGTDWCSTRPTWNAIDEYSCTAEGSLYQMTYQCPTTCSDGACDGPITKVCRDHDRTSLIGSRSYYSKNKVIASGLDGIGHTYNDECISSTILKEYICKGNVEAYKKYTCPNGCLNGACKKEVVPTEEEIPYSPPTPTLIEEEPVISTPVPTPIEEEPAISTPTPVVEPVIPIEEEPIVEIQTTARCKDSDGINLGIKGYCIEPRGDRIDDVCSGKTRIKEAFCDSSNNCNLKTYTCPANYKCSNGACIVKVQETPG